MPAQIWHYACSLALPYINRVAVFGNGLFSLCCDCFTVHWSLRVNTFVGTGWPGLCWDCLFIFLFCFVFWQNNTDFKWTCLLGSFCHNKFCMDVSYLWCKYGRGWCLQGLELNCFGLLLEIAFGCFAYKLCR